MFKFYKAFSKEENTKIATNYIKMTDIDRINFIKEQRSGTFNKKQEKKDNVSLKENKDIYRDRVNAIRNIKKD